MSTLLATVIICEILSTFLIVFGFIHEDKLIAFEDALIRAVKRKVKHTRVRMCLRYLEKEGIVFISSDKGEKRARG